MKPTLTKWIRRLAYAYGVLAWPAQALAAVAAGGPLPWDPGGVGKLVEK